MASQVHTALFLRFFFILVFSMEGQDGRAPAPTGQPRNSPGPSAQPITFPIYGVTRGSLHPKECAGRCGMRCSGTQYKKPCLFFCQKCCAKCLCVPPGTYANKQFYLCCNNWKTKRGGPKCP